MCGWNIFIIIPDIYKQRILSECETCAHAICLFTNEILDRRNFVRTEDMEHSGSARNLQELTEGLILKYV